MNGGWAVFRCWQNVTLSSGEWQVCSTEYGFKCHLRCLPNKENMECFLDVSPAESCIYSLLVDVLISLGDTDHLVERSLWESKVNVYSGVQKRLCNFTVKLRFRVIETLSPQDLTVSTAYRSLQLLCEGNSLFVDVNHLSNIGGKLFTEWKQMASKGESRIAVTNLTYSDLICLLNAIAKYRQIVIHRGNYCDLISLSFKFLISPVLRAAENFLMDVHWIHPIRKLEYAVTYRLARLGDFMVRSLVPTDKAIVVLHEFMSETGESLDRMHPDVLSSLGIHPDYVLSM